MKRKSSWPEKARALAALWPKERLHPAVLAWTTTHEGQTSRRRWLVAFSGGADSLALILLVWAHWPERRRWLRAVHFNHRLRGRAAFADERFCEAVCAALKIPLAVERWENAPKLPSEAEARAARHDFFAREFERRESSALWLGQQQDDVAETILMRLARGSGAAGLAAPRPVQKMPDGRVHLRPLLNLKKVEIVDGLTRVGARWREDATNAHDAYTRNRLRHEVLPAWRKAAGNRDALAGATLTRELLEEDDAALEAWVDEIAPVAKGGALNLRRLAHKPRALVRRALHRWIGRNAPAARLSRQAFEGLLAAVMRGERTRHSLGAQGFAVLRKGRLRLEAARGKEAQGFHMRVN